MRLNYLLLLLLLLWLRLRLLLLYLLAAMCFFVARRSSGECAMTLQEIPFRHQMLGIGGILFWCAVAIFIITVPNAHTRNHIFPLAIAVVTAVVYRIARIVIVDIVALVMSRGVVDCVVGVCAIIR